MPNLQCPKCHEKQGYIEQIGRFSFFRCPIDGYSITAKHYRAKLQESKLTDKEYLINKARRENGLHKGEKD